MIEEDEKALKNKKSSPEPKVAVLKKRKASAAKPKTTSIEEEIPSTPPAADMEEILKVMTEYLPLKLSPLGPQLMKLLQKEEPAAIKKHAEKGEGLSLLLMLLKKRHRRLQRQKHQLPKLLPPKVQLPKLRPKPQILRAHFLILIR
jgi:hypothetical protein